MNLYDRIEKITRVDDVPTWIWRLSIGTGMTEDDVMGWLFDPVYAAIVEAKRAISGSEFDIEPATIGYLLDRKAGLTPERPRRHRPKLPPIQLNRDQFRDEDLMKANVPETPEEANIEANVRGTQAKLGLSGALATAHPGERVAHLHVLGMGNYEAEIADAYEFFKYAAIADTKLFIDANLAPTHIWGGIIRSCGFKRPKENSKFAGYVLGRVRNFLREYDRVVLTGHSYGGMTAALVAMQLTPAERPFVDVATFGSIYVPRDIADDININHYMFLGDVALRCNGLRKPRMGDAIVRRQGRVIWIDPLRMRGKARMGEWDVHNAYDSLVIATMVTRDVEPFKGLLQVAGGYGLGLVNAALLGVTIAAALCQSAIAYSDMSESIFLRRGQHGRRLAGRAQNLRGRLHVRRLRRRVDRRPRLDRRAVGTRRRSLTGQGLRGRH